MVESAMQGFQLILDPMVLLYVVVGVLIGLFIGAVPGLTAMMAVTILLPVSFFIPPHVGVPFLMAITKGAIFGGSIPAILASTPGTAAAAATVADGYALARQGKAKKALEGALVGSVAGDSASDVATLFLAGVIATLALLLGPPELVLITFLGLAFIAVLTGPVIHKGLVSVGIGILLGSVGLDPLYGTPRLSFDSNYLRGGFGLIAAVIGLYAIAEAIQSGRGRYTKMPDDVKLNLGEGLTRAELRGLIPTMRRGFGTGMLLGMLPGLGQVPAAFLAYGNERRRSKNPEEFGKGSLEGVVAAETANNAVNGPTLIPLLIFGIPGDGITAVLLAAFLVHGVRPGPAIFEEQGAIVFAIFWTLLLSNIVVYLLGKLLLRALAKMSTVPPPRLLAASILFSFVAVYATRFSQTEILVMILFGLLGFVLIRLDIPREPLIVAFLLAPMLERSLGTALMIKPGPTIFFERTPSLVLMAFSLVIIVVLMRSAKKFRNIAETAPKESGSS